MRYEEMALFAAMFNWWGIRQRRLKRQQIKYSSFLQYTDASNPVYSQPFSRCPAPPEITRHFTRGNFKFHT